MEEKINVEEILKDKSQGTKLYDLLYNIDVELDTISTTDTETVVWCTNETDNNTTCLRGYSEFGTVRGCSDGLQILLPSKEMRNWGKFAWKKGDVLVNKDGDVHIIFERFADDTYCFFVGKYYLWKENNDTEHFYKNERLLTSDFQKAGKDAAQTYISTIEERLGGKLNSETLEIEKQLEFKDGDIVVYGKSVAICRKFYKHTLSFYVSLNEMFGLLFADEVESSEEYRFATESEKQQLFDALAKEGKAWDAEKKMIVDLKPKIELKPFDKVLVKNNPYESWKPALFWKKVDVRDLHSYMIIGGKRYRFCEPYEGNEHLLDD